MATLFVAAGGGGDTQAAMVEMIAAIIADKENDKEIGKYYVVGSMPSLTAHYRYLDRTEIGKNEAVRKALRGEREGFPTPEQTQKFIETVAKNSDGPIFLKPHKRTYAEMQAVGRSPYNSFDDSQALHHINAYMKENDFPELDEQVAMIQVAGGCQPKYFCRDGEPIILTGVTEQDNVRAHNELRQNVADMWMMIRMSSAIKLIVSDYGCDMLTNTNSLVTQLTTGNVAGLSRDETSLFCVLCSLYIDNTLTCNLSMRGLGCDGHLSSTKVKTCLEALGFVRDDSTTISLLNFYRYNADIVEKLPFFGEGRATHIWKRANDTGLFYDFDDDRNQQQYLLENINKRPEFRNNPGMPAAEDFPVDLLAATYQSTIDHTFGGIIASVENTPWFVKTLINLSRTYYESFIVTPTKEEVQLILKRSIVATEELHKARDVKYHMLQKIPVEMDPSNTILQKISRKCADSSGIAIARPRNINGENHIFVGNSGPNTNVLLEEKSDRMNLFYHTEEQCDDYKARLRAFVTNTSNKYKYLKEVHEMVVAFVEDPGNKLHPDLKHYVNVMSMTTRRLTLSDPLITVRLVCQTWFDGNRPDDASANFSIMSPHFQPDIIFEYCEVDLCGLRSWAILLVRMVDHMKPMYDKRFVRAL